MTPEEQERSVALLDSTSALRRRNRAGCEFCHFGAIGRLPILETLEIRKDCDHPFDPPGFKPLLAHSSELAALGEVDIFEAMEVA